jgi:hypothetical protein
MTHALDITQRIVSNIDPCSLGFQRFLLDGFGVKPADS